jgi:hypothetical protein
MAGAKVFLAAQVACFTLGCALLAALLASMLRPTGAGDTSSPRPGDSPVPSSGRRLRPGLEGQSTLEWVLIGGILVVIIVAALTTVFKPQLENILNNIMNTIQQNTTGSGTGT